MEKAREQMAYVSVSADHLYMVYYTLLIGGTADCMILHSFSITL